MKLKGRKFNGGKRRMDFVQAAIIRERVIEVLKILACRAQKFVHVSHF